MKLRLRAHAKVNLALRVGPCRSDGYHAVATVLQTIDLADRVTVSRRDPEAGSHGRPAGSPKTEAPDILDTPDTPGAPHVHLSMSWEALPGREVEVATRDNTVWRALAALHRTLQARYGAGGADGKGLPGLAVRIDKRIPPGAGLGGGSSDAAAAVVGAWKLWGGDDLEDLLEFGGARIVGAAGSDAPFFLLGGTALGTGRGDELRPLEPIEPAWMVVVAPDLAVSTAVAYAALDRDRGRGRSGGEAEGGEAQRDLPLDSVPDPGSASDPASASDSSSVADFGSVAVPEYEPDLDPAWMVNDLEGPVVEEHPEIGAIRARLEEARAVVARMTGSGSACFGVFRDRGAAEVAAVGLRAEGLWARACRTLSRREHLEGLLGTGRRRDGREAP